MATKKKQINYMQILGYVALLAPLIETIDADFSDDETDQDRKESTAHAIGATLATASQIVAQKNPRYAAHLTKLNAAINGAIEEFLTTPEPGAEEKPASGGV